MASVFTKIINGEIPSYKVYEDENYYAFLDINPIAKAHTLVVPKTEVDKFFDLNNDVLSGIMPVCKLIARSIEKVVPCDRVGLAVVGLEVPHAHVHLVALNTALDIDFAKPKLKFTPQEFEQIADLMQAEIKNIKHS